MRIVARPGLRTPLRTLLRTLLPALLPVVVLGWLTGCAPEPPGEAGLAACSGWWTEQDGDRRMHWDFEHGVQMLVQGGEQGVTDVDLFYFDPASLTAAGGSVRVTFPLKNPRELRLEGDTLHVNHWRFRRGIAEPWDPAALARTIPARWQGPEDEPVLSLDFLAGTVRFGHPDLIGRYGPDDLALLGAFQDFHADGWPLEIVFRHGRQITHLTIDRAPGRDTGLLAVRRPGGQETLFRLDVRAAAD